MKAKIADNIKTGRRGLPGGESTPASAPSSDTAQCDCSVCAAVRRELNNVAQYLDNAPHAEFERVNVEAFVRSLATLMDEAPNARLEARASKTNNGGYGNE